MMDVRRLVWNRVQHVGAWPEMSIPLALSVVSLHDDPADGLGMVHVQLRTRLTTQVFSAVWDSVHENQR